MINNCSRCELKNTRRNMIIGKGKIPNKYLIIGEFPSKSDDLLNEPFTGASGKLLDEMLIRAGINVDDCYYTTSVLCRPAIKKGGASRFPFDNELISCASNIMDIFERCSPDGVILVGKISHEFYSKTFPGCCKVHNPEWINRNGGKASAYFMDMVLRLRRLK